MCNELESEKIAESISNIFQKMEWKWDTQNFKGIPTKKMIWDTIVDKIQILQNASNKAWISSGRIAVIKSIDNTDCDGDVVDYEIMLDHWAISEDTLQLEGILK